MLSSASDKAKLVANFDDSGISSPVFPSRTNLKLHNISVTPKMVKKVITNFDSSKVSGPDFIAVMVLNSEPEFSYILGELFNMCLKESSSEVLFWTWKIVGRSHRLALYLRILGEGVQLKTTALLVVFLWLVKLVSNRIDDHLEKCCLFSDFQYSMVLGLVDQLQIFWQLYLIELLGLLVKMFWDYSSCSTWYVQGFQQGLACWSSSQT